MNISELISRLQQLADKYGDDTIVMKRKVSVADGGVVLSPIKVVDLAPNTRADVPVVAL